MHLHALVTDGAFEERGGEVRFMPASTPTPERLTAVLAQVHKAVAAVTGDDELDMDPALAACVQLGLAGPHLVPPQELATRPPLTVTAFGMHLHAATTVDGRGGVLLGLWLLLIGCQGQIYQPCSDPRSATPSSPTDAPSRPAKQRGCAP